MTLKVGYDKSVIAGPDRQSKQMPDEIGSYILFFNVAAAIITPCSVDAYDRERLLPYLAVTFCDLKFSCKDTSQND
jgi:hypothetical protein